MDQLLLRSIVTEVVVGLGLTRFVSLLALEPATLVGILPSTVFLVGLGPSFPLASIRAAADPSIVAQVPSVDITGFTRAKAVDLLIFFLPLVTTVGLVSMALVTAWAST